MHQIQLSDQLYDQAQRRAVEAGFKSIDEYVADVLTEDLCEDMETLDHLFTPERLAHIDKSAAQIKAGQGYTMEEVQEHIAQKRAEWIQENGQ
jgi:hypothetical protein